MTINLNEYNLYVADDVPPGPVPKNVPLEIIEVLKSNCINLGNPSSGYPTGLTLEDPKKPPEIFLYWKLRSPLP